MSLSTTTLPAQEQQDFLIEILQMSSDELSQSLREHGLDDKGDKATKQARLVRATLQPEPNVEQEPNEHDIERQTAPDSLNQRVDSFEGRFNALEATIQEVLDRLTSITPLEQRRGGWHPPSSSITPRRTGDLSSQQTPSPDDFEDIPPPPLPTPEDAWTASTVSPAFTIIEAQYRPKLPETKQPARPTFKRGLTPEEVQRVFLLNTTFTLREAGAP